MRAPLLLLVVGNTLALVAKSTTRSATKLTALPDEILDVAQWVSTNAQSVPLGEYAPFAAAGVAAGAMAVSGAAVLKSFERDSPIEAPLSADGRYDPQKADAYFGRRPVETILRGAEIAGRAASLGLAIGVDVVTNAIAKNEKRRATTLVDSLVSLGPTFVKVGQALSIRSDLLSEAYCDALTTLQDACPPFDDTVARAFIEDQVGKDAFVELSPKVIASASLGQVYVGYVGEERRKVAVKVQRPGVSETIALDLHLLRIGARPLQALFRANTDLVGIVDAWGDRFVDELDYVREAGHAVSFSAAIAETPLSGAVFAPEPLMALTTRSVLTTTWVEGQRLDYVADASEDGQLRQKRRVSQLCGVAMNAYLTMMLETGILHADPHPGNLIVEEATGRLAILDWGLVTELDPELRVSYIEHIAHLVAKDYASVPNDLVKLGFVPEGYEEAIASGDAVEVLANVYTQFAGGGGAAKIDVPEVLGTMRALADRQGNLFRLPPYFAYIARAFSVLEGIGLKNDPDYAIVGECLPYVSQRLLSDPSPRVAKALETFVYGADGDKQLVKRVDADRLTYLVDGLQSYSRSETGNEVDTDVLDDAVGVARKVADLLLVDAEEPTPLQSIVEAELAKVLGASLRLSFAQARDSRAGTLARTLVDPFGVLDPLLKGRLSSPDRDDKIQLSTLSRVATRAGGELGDAVGSLADLPQDEQRAALTELRDILWQNRVGASRASRRIAALLLEQGLDRVGA
jgi:predicted unusual protein kinase regulating ubiquinone biosynthesis (AarF/ABC1/UbiB family)